MCYFCPLHVNLDISIMKLPQWSKLQLILSVSTSTGWFLKTYLTVCAPTVNELPVFGQYMQLVLPQTTHYEILQL